MKTPLDQCRCQMHENFIFKLSALNIKYHDDFWEKHLCERQSENINFSCWAGTCQQCSDGTKIDLDKDLPSIVKYREWVVDEELNCRCIKKFSDPKSVHLLLLSDYPQFRYHVQVKRIQESSFSNVKAKLDAGIIQIDFAMAYSCGYQNEIQNALWTRASINLFTLAHFVNQEVECHLFVLDNYKKDKDAIFACLKKFYAKP